MQPKKRQLITVKKFSKTANNLQLKIKKDDPKKDVNIKINQFNEYVFNVGKHLFANNFPAKRREVSHSIKFFIRKPKTPERNQN